MVPNRTTRSKESREACHKELRDLRDDSAVVWGSMILNRDSCYQEDSCIRPPVKQELMACLRGYFHFWKFKASIKLLSNNSRNDQKCHFGGFGVFRHLLLKKWRYIARNMYKYPKIRKTIKSEFQISLSEFLGSSIWEFLCSFL